MARFVTILSKRERQYLETCNPLSGDRDRAIIASACGTDRKSRIDSTAVSGRRESSLQKESRRGGGDGLARKRGRWAWRALKMIVPPCKN